MKPPTHKTSRRSFFVKGGAALGGAAAAFTAPAEAKPSENSQAQLRALEDRDAARDLLLKFMCAVESSDFDTAVALFAPRGQLNLGDEAVQGTIAIRQFFGKNYALQQGQGLHSAYRHRAALIPIDIQIDADRQTASVNVATDAKLVTPLTADCTAAQMAKLQGQWADERWVEGRFVAQLIKTDGRWKFAALRFAQG